MSDYTVINLKVMSGDGEISFQIKMDTPSGS